MRSALNRLQERIKTFDALSTRKGDHKYLADTSQILAAPGKALEAAENGIGLGAAKAADATKLREDAEKKVNPFLAQSRSYAVAGLTGDAAHRAALHYILEGDTQPRSFAAKEGALKFIVGALHGGTEKWQKDALATATQLLSDLEGAAPQADSTPAKTRAAYKDAAAAWDVAYEVAKHLVAAAGLLLEDEKLYGEVIWTHPRHEKKPASQAA